MDLFRIGYGRCFGSIRRRRVEGVGELGVGGVGVELVRGGYFS